MLSAQLWYTCSKRIYIGENWFSKKNLFLFSCPCERYSVREILLLVGCMRDRPLLNDLKCQFISYKFEIWTNELARDVGYCTRHNPLFDKTKIPLWAVIFVYLFGVTFTRFVAPPLSFCLDPGWFPWESTERLITVLLYSQMSFKAF